MIFLICKICISEVNIMAAVNMGKNRQVFWDDYLVDTEKTTASARMIQPTKKECVFEFDQKNETFSISYPCVVKDEAGYKMYYQPWIKEGLKPCVCVIESVDGIHWHRPHLDIFDNDLAENNVVIDQVKDGVFVFYDTNPACPKEEKYKAVGVARITYPDGEEKTALCCYISSDGYRFTLSHPMTRFGTFDSLNTAMWDGEKYVCFYRSFHNIIGVDNSEILDISQIYSHSKMWSYATRDIRVMYSDDFRHWSLPELVEFDDGKDYPLYTNNIQIYDRAPQMKIGFPVRYCERKEWTKNVEQMTSYLTKKKATETIEDRTGRVATDCIFICSRDSKTWHRFNEAFLTPGYEEEHNWIYGDCYLAYGLIDSGREYYNLYTIDRHFSFGYSKPLNRYEIRKDGFACYMAGGDEATLVTKPIVFDGKIPHINFSTSAYGYIYMSVLDEDGREISGESFEIYGDNIDRAVYFADGEDFSRFASMPVRLKFRMRDAKLFSIKFE